MSGFVCGCTSEVLLDGVFASDFLHEYSHSGEIDTAETTVFSNTSKTYVPGLEDASVSFSGKFDTDTTTDTDSFSYKLDALKGVTTQLTLIPHGDVFGDPALLCKGLLTSQSTATSVDDVGSAEVEFQNTTGLERALILHPLAAKTVTGEGTALDNGASGSPTEDGASAILHVTAVSGTDTPTLTVKVEHSADDITYADLITFNAATGVGSQYGTATGTVNRYLKVTYTISGTNPSFTFHVAANRK